MVTEGDARKSIKRRTANMAVGKKSCLLHFSGICVTQLGYRGNCKPSPLDHASPFAKLRRESRWADKSNATLLNHRDLLLIGPDTTFTRIGSVLDNMAGYYIY